MSELEEKEKHLTKLKVKVDNLLANNHPASDKIEVSASFFVYLFYSCTLDAFKHTALVFS